MPLALYRKYRPKKLTDLLGQETNVEILKNAARKNALGQAYLFYGPRGTGKTTTARLIAKLANCERRETDEAFRALGEPCNECRVCKEIDANASLGVVEIDAASNRGIDEIRNLKEDIQSAPAGVAYKVYIIDEAHMLTTAAFNALLKTLEEPPRHAIFILATTEYEKLPPTITSRTQRFLFRKLSKPTILGKLRTIAKEEKLKISEEALELIAAAGDGSFRDAESLLDQIASAHDSKTTIDLKAAERLTGRIGFQAIDHLAELILKKDLANALEALTKASEEGLNVVQLTRDLIHYLRKVLTLKLNPELEKQMHTDLTAEEVKRVKFLSALADEKSTVHLLQALIRAYTEIRYSPFALIPLEIALIDQLSTGQKE
ncbi:MAG TPA: DNA polymerase III subunit gamma/tau [Candidatus Paceibacterota bacterium]|nr:DNA polymerase III subunit gamma/tau [Candidatus Paceibacterota bacterium]